MKALSTLLRIARRELDELRQEMSALERRRADQQNRLLTHEQALAREQQLALESYEGARAYGGYAAVALAQRRALNEAIVATESEVDALRARIVAAHQEVKKAERLIELAAARAAEAERRRDDAELDEIATIRAARARR